MSKKRLCSANDDPVTVEVIRDGRLKKTIRWQWEGSQVRVRAPKHVSQRELDQHVAEIIEKVRRKRAQVRIRADADLEARARQINERYFGGEIVWHSIRWVNNMRKRLGSCTNGGPTDGDIRLSRQIKGWPDWVVDYVIAHEMAHRQHPNHTKRFWAYVGRYPMAERARGFIQGVAFQLGKEAEEWL
jgi:predicted metal-dependent hydrolase